MTKMKNNDLFNQFTKQLMTTIKPAGDFHIALSGGLDSVVLLHLFFRLKSQQPSFNISAHHVNHGLSQHAEEWSEFCAEYCHRLAINFSVSKVQLSKQSRTSLEALAREKRYQALQQDLTSTSYLVTAHHQDDQLETILLALKRGSGITGLQGIQACQKMPVGYLLRPLLGFSRQQLEAYAQLHNLQWIEDDSNSNQDFDRNFIRHSITPLLKARWPSIAKSFSRSAEICQQQQQVLDEIAQQDYHAVLYCFLNQQALSISALNELSVGRRNNVLRLWFKKHQLAYPSAVQLQTIWTDVVLADVNALPSMQLKAHSIRRYLDHLYLVNGQDIAQNHSQLLPWQGQSRLSFADGRVQLQLGFVDNLDSAEEIIKCANNAQIEICFRSHLPTTLRCQPIGRNGSRSIKKLLHEYQVAPWLRDLVPFVLIDGELRAAVGLWLCESTSTQPQLANFYCRLSS